MKPWSEELGDDAPPPPSWRPAIVTGALAALVLGALAYNAYHAPPARVAREPSSAAGPPVVRDARMEELLRLRRAQDEYLKVLRSAPEGDPRAMAGLVGMRRRMAHDDPGTLRLQANAYQQAAERGIALGNYSPDTLRLLARATSLAAEQSAADRDRQVAASTARALPTPRVDARPFPGVKPRPQPPAPPPRQPSTGSRVHAAGEHPRRGRPLAAQRTQSSPASRNMPLPDLVRKLVHERTGRWISYAQAVAAIDAVQHAGHKAGAAHRRPPVEAGEK